MRQSGGRDPRTGAPPRSDLFYDEIVEKALTRGLHDFGIVVDRFVEKPLETHAIDRGEDEGRLMLGIDLTENALFHAFFNNLGTGITEFRVMP